MNNNDLVIANNLAYKINNNKLFSNISFKLQSGESLHINGPNGCGKSTLIRIILGVTKPNKGDVRISKDHKISYLGHKNALKEYLSVEDNISLLNFNDNIHLPKYLKFLQLNNLMDVYVSNLSFGQKKKLALLRVFLNKSNIFLLDEPFVGLDSYSHEFLHTFLTNELKHGKCLIFTSHIKTDFNSKNIILGKS